MPNGTYGGVRGRKTKVGRKLLRFPLTRLNPLQPVKTSLVGEAKRLLPKMGNSLRHSIKLNNLLIEDISNAYLEAPAFIIVAVQ